MFGLCLGLGNGQRFILAKAEEGVEKKVSNLCASCGDTLGSRYHEVAHLPDVETVSSEELEMMADGRFAAADHLVQE